MNERIKELRKTLNLNQTDFGYRIGVKQGSVAAYENGIRAPLEAVILSICREFCVNEEWLRNGVGDMFKDIDEDEEVAIYVSELLENEKNPFNDLIIQIMRTYYKLDQKSQQVIDATISNLLENMQAEKKD